MMDTQRRPSLILVFAFQALFYGGLAVLLFIPTVGVGMLIAALVCFLALRTRVQ